MHDPAAGQGETGLRRVRLLVGQGQQDSVVAEQGPLVEQAGMLYERASRAIASLTG